MNFIERAIRAFDQANLSFGLREAVIISLAGIAIASIVAYHYAG